MDTADFKDILKNENKKIDSLYKTIGGVVLFCSCTALAWTANSVISLKTDVTALQGRANTIEATNSAATTESNRRFDEFGKRLEKVEVDLSKKLESIEEKLDRYINKHTIP